FERGFRYSEALATLYSQFVIQVEHWKNLHRQRFVELSFKGMAASLQIRDSRFGDTEEYDLPLAPSMLYRLLDSRPTRVDAARRELQSVLPLSDVEFTGALSLLDERRLIWRDGDVLLGLAVPVEIAERHRANQWPKKWNSIYV